MFYQIAYSQSLLHFVLWNYQNQPLIYLLDMTVAIRWKWISCILTNNFYPVMICNERECLKTVFGLRFKWFYTERLTLTLIHHHHHHHRWVRFYKTKDRIFTYNVYVCTLCTVCTVYNINYVPIRWVGAATLSSHFMNSRASRTLLSEHL